MKKYMIVYEIKDDHEGLDSVHGASFADDYTEAKNKKMDIECGLGGYAEIYGREEYDGQPPEYVLIEA